MCTVIYTLKKRNLMGSYNSKPPPNESKIEEANNEVKREKYERALYDEFPAVEQFITCTYVNDSFENPEEYDVLTSYSVQVDEGGKVSTKKISVEHIVTRLEGIEVSHEIWIQYDGDDHGKTFDIQLILPENKFNDEDYCDPETIRELMRDLHIEITAENVKKLMNGLIIKEVHEKLLERVVHNVIPDHHIIFAP